MPFWKKENFKLKDLISHEDISDNTAKILAAQTILRLDEFKGFLPDTKEEIKEAFIDVNCQDDFNEALVVLYDAADIERIWIE